MERLSLLLKEVRRRGPLVHQLIGAVGAGECAGMLRIFGATPAMALAADEIDELAESAAAVILDGGILAGDLAAAASRAVQIAGQRDVPVVLDAGGAALTRARAQRCRDLLARCRVDVVRGAAADIAVLGDEPPPVPVPAGNNGNGAGSNGAGGNGAGGNGNGNGNGAGGNGAGGNGTGVNGETVVALARWLSAARGMTVVVTGKEAAVARGKDALLVRNGHAMVDRVFAAGLMTSGVIAAFAAVEPDRLRAAAAALACFGIAAELAARSGQGPGTFRQALLDAVSNLDDIAVAESQRVTQA